jgi:hypothetical protein
MALKSRAFLRKSPRLAPTATILAMGFVAAILVAAISSLVGENYRAEPPFLDPFRAPTRDEAVLVYPAEYALKSTEYNDVVFLGDSTCRCSIDPATFQRLSGLSAYNLGSMGGLGLDGYRLLLQIYLQHHPKPRAVVLAVTPDDFDIEMSQALGDWPHRFRWSYGPDRNATLRWPKNLESLMFFARRGVQIGRDYGADFSAQHRYDPRVEALVGGGKDTYLTLQRKVLQSRGFWALAGKHWPPGTDPPNKAQVTVAKQWRPGLQELVNVAEANGVRLIVRLVPIVDKTKTDYGPVRSWLKDLQRSYAQLTVIQPEIVFYDAELCWDYQHLNAEGVEKFSRSLAQDVGATLARNSNRPPHKNAAEVTERAGTK